MSLDIICTMVDGDNNPVRGSIVLRQLDTGNRSEASVVIESGSTGEVSEDGVYRLTERVLGLAEKVWTVDVVSADWASPPVPYEDLPTAYGYDCASRAGRTYGAAVVHAAGCDCVAIDGRLAALEGGATGHTFDPSAILTRLTGLDGVNVDLTRVLLALLSIDPPIPEEWVPGKAYHEYDVVLSQGSLYLALAASTGVEPGTDPHKWDRLSVPKNAMDIAALWDGTKRHFDWLRSLLGMTWGSTYMYPYKAANQYVPPTMVTYQERIYRALVTSTGVTPGTDPAKWELVLSLPDIRTRLVALEAAGGGVTQQNLVAALARITSQEEITNDLLKDTPSVYASASAYSSGDVVSYQGGLYVARGSVTGIVPGTDPAKWDSMAIPDLLARIAALEATP